jgi:type IV pilus assembly protein PilB
MARNVKKRLGDILLERGLLTKEQLEKALKIQQISGKRLGEVLIDEGFITEKEIIKVLELQLGIPYIGLNKVVIDPETVKLLPEHIARKYKAIPVNKEDNKLVVALSDPLNILAIDDLKMITGMDIKAAIATREEIERTIDRYYSSKDSIQKVLQEMKDEIEDEIAAATVFEKNDEEERAPVIRLVNTVIQRAIKEGASDIHIEPQEKDIRVRYRIDGELHEVIKWHKNLLHSVVTRIKIMAGMDITQKRVPQDGHIELSADDAGIDLRVSTLPTIHGEKVVLRVFNRKNTLLSLDQLGFDEQEVKILQAMLNYPYGMILVTGPTGSGKTTTLYSMLNAINSPSKNIVTLEDPVEYILPGVNQVQINPKAGITFAGGLRSILRQDPNVIMVGEIRDSETADIAIRAALTGHLFFSTLHTNNAAGAITRLIDMGIEPYLVASCLVGVIAQRLVRTICPYCRETYKAIDREKIALGMEETILYRGRGCNFCNHTGFRGRTAIGEILLISPAHRELITKRASIQQLTKISSELGYRSLKESGINLVKKGITTLDEIMKVIFADEET